MRATDPEPIARHKARYHGDFGKSYEDAAHAPSLWRRPGLVRTWRALVPILGWCVVGGALWLVCGIVYALTSGRVP